MNEMDKHSVVYIWQQAKTIFSDLFNPLIGFPEQIHEKIPPRFNNPNRIVKAKRTSFV